MRRLERNTPGAKGKSAIQYQEAKHNPAPKYKVPSGTWFIPAETVTLMVAGMSGACRQMIAAAYVTMRQK